MWKEKLLIGLGALLLLVAIIGICLGTLGTFIMGIVWIVTAFLHIAILIPFWPFPVAIFVGIVALFCNIQVYAYLEEPTC